MKTIVVFRLSAMGDVVMTLPIIKGVLEANPDLQLVIVTRPLFANFFKDLDRIKILNVDLKGKHKGAMGLFRLAKTINKEYQPQAFIDLHAVLRSVVVSFFMKGFGIPVYRIRKDRKDKKEAIKTKDFSRPFQSTFERYETPFKQLELAIAKPQNPIFSFVNKNNNLLDAFKSDTSLEKSIKIGFAPFAKHKQKMWPLSHIKQLIAKLEDNYNCSIFLFGGGKVEIDQLTVIANEKPNRHLAAKLTSITDEIDLISKMDLMLAMDSGNMHFAAIANTPVFSIWGGTSPLLGFAPYNVDASFQIEPSKHFECRPCSVFGGKPCIYHDKVECMHSISTDEVYERFANFIENNISNVKV